MDSTNNWLGFNGAVVADLHPPPQHGMEEAEQPKLDNFLLVQEPTTTAPAPSGRPFGRGGASTTGLSMIKNWLRIQPAPAGAADSNMALVPALLPEGNGTVAGAAGVSGGSVVETTQQMTKPPVETFGQRTSIYRGVTK
jgi:AP2-like factor, ANT lineage